MLGTFMAVLDATIVNVGLPKIMSSFGVGISKIEWVITAYMLALAVMLPTSGWLADKFGYKLIYFLGLLTFTLGSLLCGLSGNEYMLISSRVLQGLGGGMIQPLGMAIISREFPPEKRGIAIGFWVISAAASVSFGPLIGGYLVDNFSWQSIFWVNVPVGIFALFVTFVIQEEYKSKKIRKFDLAGFISVVIFLPLMLFALSEGNAATNSEGWSAPYILVSFAISIIALAVFITVELTVKEPLIDLSLLKDVNFGISNLIMLLFGIGVFGGVFLLPLYLQNAMGYTALQSGAVFLPVGIIQGLIAPLTGIITDRINPKIPIMTGILLFAISFFIFSRLSFLTERDYIMLSLYLRGVAMGMMFTSLSTVALFNIPREKMAQASGMLNTIRQLGGSLGIAIMATILSSRINYHVQMFGGAIQTQSVAYKNTMGHLNYYVQQHAGSPHAIAGKLSHYLLLSNVNTQGYIQGINDVFLVATGITLLGLIPIFFLQGKKKKQKQLIKNHSNE
jgi:MFS transporter, DHA2 family, multidrug resistance protein